MRRMGIIAACALAFCLAVCLAARIAIGDIVENALRMRTQAVSHMEAGEIQPAEEILCEHEDLHEIKEQLIDAQASIEFGSREDFYQAIYRFGERMEHISDVESLRFSNFY